MKIDGALRQRPQQRDPRDFAEAWNGLATFAEMRRRFLFGTDNALRSWASVQRRRGVSLVSRRSAKDTKPRPVVRRRGDHAAAIAETALARVAVPPAVIFNADHQPVAILDPVSRRRHAVKPGESAREAVARLNLNPKPAKTEPFRYATDGELVGAMDLG